MPAPPHQPQHSRLAKIGLGGEIVRPPDVVAILKANGTWPMASYLARIRKNLGLMFTMLQYLSIFGLLTTPALTHSWAERLMRVELTGTMTGTPGYIRGAVSRLDPAFNDEQMQNRILPDDKIYDDHICKLTQRFANYSSTFPPLSAFPGDIIALQYQENGHVTLPNTVLKPSSGQVYIYGTSEPMETDKLSEIHKVWDNEGTGGDQRGKLLAVRPFDDGRCYQINEGSISAERQMAYKKIPQDPQGADLWCQNNIRLPVDAEGDYTLYWIWDWPSRPSCEFPKGKAEIYTSCADIRLLQEKKEGKVSYITGQDLNSAAIQEQMEDL